MNTFLKRVVLFIIIFSTLFTLNFLISCSGGGGGGGTELIPDPSLICNNNGVCDEGEGYENCPSDCLQNTGDVDTGGDSAAGGDGGTDGAVQDTTPPSVAGTTPTNLASEVDVNTNITVVFSEPMAAASINRESLIVRNGDAVVDGEITYNPDTNTAVFNPVSNLGSLTEYVVSVTTAVSDLVGNRIAAEYSWSFRTMDAESPIRLSYSPVDAAINVPVNNVVSIEFNEAMDCGSVNPTTFRVVLLAAAGGEESDLAGTLECGGSRINYTHAEHFLSNRVYRVVVSGSIDDLSSNPLGRDIVWSFTARRILHVDHLVADGGDGLSWGGAFNSLNDALTAALPGDPIWIASGTYYPSGAGEPRDASFNIIGKDGLLLYGGFPPAGGDGRFEARDADVNVTVLSGEIGDPGSLLDNICVIVRVEGAEDILIDGLTVSDAYGAGCDTQGGINVSNESGVTLRDLNVINNRSTASGAGIYASNSNLEIFDSVIGGNRCTGAACSGGGIFISGGSLNIERSEIRSNQVARFGGGIEVTDSDVSAREVLFYRNKTEIISGGGMDIRGAGSPAVLENLTFQGNFAPSGGGLNIEGDRTFLLTNSVFSGNIGNFDSGLSIYGPAQLTLLNTTVAGNYASDGGWSVAALEMHLASSIVSMINCAVYGNMNFAGSDIQIDKNEGDLYITHSFVQGALNARAEWQSDLYGIDGGGNVDKDVSPFIALPNLGPVLTDSSDDITYGNLDLAVGVNYAVGVGLSDPSVDIDRDGDLDPISVPAHDIAGRTRIVGESIDMGAYERE